MHLFQQTVDTLRNDVTLLYILGIDHSQNPFLDQAPDFSAHRLEQDGDAE